MGLTMIWSISGIPDFAQGGIYVFAGFTAYFAVTLAGIPYPLSIIAAAIVGACMAMLFERLCYRPLRGSPQSQLLAAIALFFLLENLAVFLWTPKARMLSSPFTEIVISIGGISLSLQRLVILFMAGLLFVAVNILLKKTKLGKAIRAAAQDMEAAALMGININRVYQASFAIGGGLTGIAASLISPLYAVYAGMGVLPLLKALVVVILGGLGSFMGALVAGLILGVTEAFAATYVSVAYQHGVAFVILILTLVLRPGGLFGRRY